MSIHVTTNQSMIGHFHDPKKFSCVSFQMNVSVFILPIQWFCVCLCLCVCLASFAQLVVWRVIHVVVSINSCLFRWQVVVHGRDGLSFLLLMDIWMVSTFGVLKTRLL
jgi:hypothetical protein